MASLAAFVRRLAPAGLFALMIAGWSGARADWSTYQGDASHTGYVAGTYDASVASQAWQTAVSPYPLTGLAVGNGTVIATNQAPFSNQASIRAIDEKTGTVLWSKSYGTSNDTTSPPAYANGLVYVQVDGHSAGAGNFLNAYNVRTGALMFSATYAVQWETYLNPTPYGGNVYVGGGYYGGMYSFNGATGAQNWFGSVPQYDGWTPALDGKYAYAYTGSGSTTPINGVFTMINMATGAVAASVVDPTYNWTGYTMNSAVVLGTHHDAFTINGNRLVSWDTTLDASHTPHIAWSVTDGFSGQATLANGRLYVINHGALTVLDELTGSTLWSWTAPSGTLGGPLIVTDNLVFAETGSTTFAIDLSSHSSVWSYDVSGTMAFSDATLFVGGADGIVHAISIPEPRSIILAALGMIGGLIHHRRASRKPAGRRSARPAPGPL